MESGVREGEREKEKWEKRGSYGVSGSQTSRNPSHLQVTCKVPYKVLGYPYRLPYKVRGY